MSRVEKNKDGTFIKGRRYSPATEFKKGQHWRPKKPWWEREWLFNEYVTKQKSAPDIAKEHGVTDAAISFWLVKHKIPTRTVSQARAIKHWGLSGESNPMFGKRGVLNVNWQGGMTPARQKIYARAEWRQLVRDVYARDKCCRLCGSKERLEIHHIDPFSQAPLLMLDIGNVILLCFDCHRNLRGKEQKWKRKLFAIIQRERR